MSDAQIFLEIAVKVQKHLTDAVCNFIIENICNGLILEEEDNAADTVIKFYLQDNLEKDYRTLLSKYFESLIELDQNLKEIPQITEKRIQNVEWEDAYKKSVMPVIITGDVSVRPPWEEKSDKVKYDIIIEPKMAFGTGKHETTRSCLKIIREHFKNGMTFLDIGCGSGILAVLADKLGSSYIKAVDYDIVSVDNCRENFAINNVTTKYDITLGSIEQCENDQPYDFVCANIIKATILEMLRELKRLTGENGILVLSGLLDKDRKDIVKALNDLELNRFDVFEDNEWLTFTIVK